MQKIIKVLLISFIFSSSYCTVKRADGERAYLQFYGYAPSKESQKYCFDDIRGTGRPSISKLCAEGSIDVIKLPLNIAVDSSMFFFTKDGKKDTILITYRRLVQQIGDSYINRFANLKVKKATFDNFKCTCFQDTTTCDDQSFEAYIIF